MRMSCNGCRVLRKGCSEDCSIRPCLQWIKNPEAQANATVFLAKFYGRAGLMNLINSGPDNLRPAIFRSLLYEACGRIVNPIYGSVGLLWSANWHLCQAAVNSVLKGEPIVQIPFDTAACAPVPPLKAYNIRHVTKESDVDSSKPAADLHKINGVRTKFKRAGARKSVQDPVESSWSHVSEQDESMGSHVSQNEPGEEESKVELELTLGFEPASRAPPRLRTEPEIRHDEDTCHLHLGLKLSA